MAERPARRPSHLQDRRLSIQDEEKDEIAWAPYTSSASFVADRISDSSIPSYTMPLQANSTFATGPVHSNTNPLGTRLPLADQQWLPFRLDPARPAANDTDTGSAVLRNESRGQGAQETDIGGQQKLQGTKRARVTTLRPLMTGESPVQRARAGSQLASSLGYASENAGPEPPFSGSLESRSAISQRFSLSHAMDPLSQLSYPMTMLLSEGALQGSSSSITLPAETQLGHSSHVQSHDGSSITNIHLQDIPAAIQTELSDDSEDLEEEHSPYRKRRRSAISSPGVTASETHWLAEKQRPTFITTNLQGIYSSSSAASDLSLAKKRLGLELPRAHLIRDSFISYNIDSLIRGVNWNAETELPIVLSALSRAANIQVNTFQDYDDVRVRMAAREELSKICDCLKLYLPPPLPLGSKSIFFLSETFPRSFDLRKRSALLKIFQTRAPYVPSCINLASGLRCGIQYHVCSPTPQRRRRTKLPLGPTGRGWPNNCLPLEVFRIISDFLPRESLKSMRLVNHEFESKVSSTLFRTVVVGFRPEIYSMMLPNSGKPRSTKVDIKGKRKELAEQTDESLHDGIRIFQGWGPHTKKFAMAFEVEESMLEKPPIKGKFETHPTFWGRYKWPHPYYNRFEYCEGLEKKADEFVCMSNALSCLTEVRELALSIDGGLGWLNGPDLSNEARLSREKPRIFGKREQSPDAPSPKYRGSWKRDSKSAIQSHTSLQRSNEHGLYEARLEWQPDTNHRRPIQISFHEQPEPDAFESSMNRFLSLTHIAVGQGAHDPIDEELSEFESVSGCSKLALIPNALSIPQREWLLETEWAQRAFLSSFCMALCDNSQTFSMLTTLNIARLSSRHLQSFQRTDIWLALKKLNSLTIHVIADWRNVVKAASGLVDVPSIRPSTAAGQFFDVLKTQISTLQTVKKLNVGFVGGGEHQTGVYGRNRFVLPAPVADFAQHGFSYFWTPVCEGLLSLPYVEDLTFTNCWFVPDALKIFCARARLNGMRILRLKSVSLTSAAARSIKTEELSAELFLVPQGRPRHGDPSLGNFFDLRPDNVPDPSPGGWTTEPQRMGSWGNVIDCVTPGANLDFVRYAYRYYDEKNFDPSKRPDSGNLEEITFESCGYVCLNPFKDLPPSRGEVPDNTIPPLLRRRAAEIAPHVMEAKSDEFLGQIVPSFPNGEAEVLQTGFPMQFGWTDEAKATECIEDGQPRGGSGRFSGKVQRMTLPN